MLCQYRHMTSVQNPADMRTMSDKFRINENGSQPKSFYLEKSSNLEF